jgi:hypothetical protein
VVGESNRRIPYRRPVAQAIEDLKTAFAEAGSLLEVNESTQLVAGRVRYGLQAIRLRVTVFADGASASVLEIQGFGDDIWGGGARKGTDKLLRTLEALETGRRPATPPPADTTEGWKPDPTGRYPDRYFDGTAWTIWVRDKPGGTRSEDPAVMPELAQAPDAPAGATGIPSVADEIRKLAELRHEGLITDDEYTAHKAKLLG